MDLESWRRQSLWATVKSLAVKEKSVAMWRTQSRKSASRNSVEEAVPQLLSTNLTPGAGAIHSYQQKSQKNLDKPLLGDFFFIGWQATTLSIQSQSNVGDLCRHNSWKFLYNPMSIQLRCTNCNFSTPKQGQVSSLSTPRFGDIVPRELILIRLVIRSYRFKSTGKPGVWTNTS